MQSDSPPSINEVRQGKSKLLHLSAVEAACAESLAAGLASADVILNALARRQQPAPCTPIEIPERLALKLPPIADCARYDALRAETSMEALAMEGLHGAL